MLSAVHCLVVGTLAVHFHEYRIKSFDGTELAANSFEPSEITEPVPLVILGNSWGVPGIEYVLPTREFAERGYIALEYEARGFYTSGGIIGTAGPDDVRDHSAVVDWALEHWGDKVNKSAIAAGGISYGSGLALMAAANDSRITACFAMSTWKSLVEALWWNQAPSLFWGYFLEVVGKATGRAPPVLDEMLSNLLKHENIPETVAWAEVRSPETTLDKLNARNTPVLITSQFEDNMLHSNFQLNLWQQITGPKRLILAQGTHAEADGRGLFPLGGSYMWDQVFAWTDRFLKGKQNGADQAPLVTVSLSDHHDPLIPGKPVYTHAKYSSWPPVEASEQYRVLRFGLQSRTVSGEKFGKLVANGVSSTSLDVIQYTNHTKMTCGIPLIGPALRPWAVHTMDANDVDSKYELVFFTEPVTETTRVCGHFNITGLVATPSQDDFEVMAYLWTVKPKNFFGSRKAALLTHGPLNMYGSRANQRTLVRPLTFHAACRDIKKGDSLMLGINLHNSLYKGCNDDANLNVRFEYSTETLLNVESAAVL